MWVEGRPGHEVWSLYNGGANPDRMRDAERGMRMKAWIAMLGMAVALLGQPVLAAPWDFRPGLQQQDRRNPPPRQPQNDRRDPRGAPQRDDGHRQRLSDEERRDLRRDIDRADRELYRRKGQR